MAIDNPLDQALAQVEAEKRDSNPAIERLASARPFLRFGAAALAALKAGDLSEVVSTLRDWSDMFACERSEYLIRVVISELRELWENFQRLNQSHQEYLDRDWPALFLDAERKARETRARDKIERIGKIVSSAAHVPQPPDETEELMRSAMSLDDADVRMLSELVRGQREAFIPNLGSVPGEVVNNYWRSGETATNETPASARSQKAGRLSGVAIRLDIPEGAVQARCAKLQAFGLVVQVDRNNNKNGPGVLPYAILARGIEFIDSIRSFAGSDTLGSP